MSPTRPTVLLAIAFTVLSALTLDIPLAAFGAAADSGSGVALGAVRRIGPLITVVVVAVAVAMCADLGGRTIWEELDAIRLTAVNPASYYADASAIART